MNWLKRRLRNWAFSSDATEKMSSNKVPRRGLTVSAEGETFSTEPIRLSIYHANGGTVIETRQYNRVTDRSSTELYVVGHDSDLSTTISQVITMESLRR
ncbi:hypothetical protein UFOVP1636_29 [uncultured Caudovirales phage]|uniref:Uncharacterized protein n=1 Tax=uncultured Caudovirales phage TaxID=2100421 RepID=A0A6J5T0B3_9CAUD|nr:hypothetical protein UFOVP1636_29 [uncultured Caudovirales phage]